MLPIAVEVVIYKNFNVIIYVVGCCNKFNDMYIGLSGDLFHTLLHMLLLKCMEVIKLEVKESLESCIISLNTLQYTFMFEVSE